MSENLSLKSRIASDIRFLKGWVRQPKSVGSITPTSRPAAELMASLIPRQSDLPVLELGPGTGPVTRAILASGISPERLVSVEFNPDFCAHLQERYPGVRFIRGDAFDLATSLEAFAGQKFAAILSGLPLLNYAPERRTQYVEDALEWLAPDAPFVQLCYGPRQPVRAKKDAYTTVPTKWVLSNVPPARFWIYRRERPTS